MLAFVSHTRRTSWDWASAIYTSVLVHAKIGWGSACSLKEVDAQDWLVGRCFWAQRFSSRYRRYVTCSLVLHECTLLSAACIVFQVVVASSHYVAVT